jgi:hypothetical protein
MARPVYMGLRDSRYGPLVSSVATRWWGTIVVRCLITAATAVKDNPSPSAVTTAPAIAVAGRPPRGKATRAFAAMPPARPAA